MDDHRNAHSARSPPGGCLSDTDEGHANSLAVIKKWFGETPTAHEVLSGLK